MVTSSGQLGVSSASSERFKTAISGMGERTSKLDRVRPVTFHLKINPNGPIQYGLVAEEVAAVYPELVIRDENGRVDGVRYDELGAMLLNEMKRKLAAQDQRLAAQAREIRELQANMLALVRARKPNVGDPD